MKKKIAILLVLALSGCAAMYEKKLASFKGATESELIRSWGAPHRAYESDGRKFLTYQSSRVAAYRGMAASYSCQTTFELENGLVVSTNFTGNDC
ncbi:hypothetical protein SAMN05216316_1101 [Nitrosovibrio sp. Nv6]|nr:hypothetical protein SAMN05216316_1101 [Nitrosovibrio sp. Nv6]